VPVGSEVSMTFLHILAINAFLVGMSLGVLLPILVPGICFGGALALFVGAFATVSNPFFFPVVGCTAAMLFGVASARYVPRNPLGALAATAVLRTKALHSLSRLLCFLIFRFDSTIFVSYTTSLEGGAVAACLVLKGMLPYLMDVARGYPYYPASEDGNVGIPLAKEIVFSIMWLASSALVAAGCVYRDQSFSSFSIMGLFRHGYSPIPTSDGQATNARRKKDLPSMTRDPAIPQQDAFNMFDPADLPPRLAEYANMVYSACEDLGNFFGFQDSSVRNQAEHLLILLSNNRRYMSSHILPPSVQPPSPIHSLHAKVFSNYVKWCRAMGVLPNFSKMNTSMNAPPAVASRVVDLVLYFCVWGESSNLRHMPECLWFLYHKMMEEYIQSEGYAKTRSLYAGHFLDSVITPIYEILAMVRNCSLPSLLLWCLYEHFSPSFSLFRRT